MSREIVVHKAMCTHCHEEPQTAGPGTWCDDCGFWRPSASSLQRVEKCPPSALLPADSLTLPQGEDGTAVHQFLLGWGYGMEPEEALAELDLDPFGRAAQIIANLPLAELPRGGGRLELALAYDPRANTARVLGENIDRAYREHGLLPWEYPGSADYAAVDRARQRGLVLDWKTGRYVTRARSSLQLGLLALGLAALEDLEEVLVGNVRIDEEGNVRWDMALLSGLDLARLRWQIAEIDDALIEQRRSRYRLSEGSWCTLCPAIRACPAKTSALATFVGALEHQVGAPLTLERLGEVVVKLERAEELVELLRDKINDIARQHAIPLPDGREYRMALGAARDQVTPGARTLEALKQVIDEDLALAAASFSKEAIKEAARVHAKRAGRPIGTTQGQVIGELRGRGLINKVAGEEKPRLITAKGETP